VNHAILPGSLVPQKDITFDLLDENDQLIPAVSGFMRYLRTRGNSPKTLSAYAYDLFHFMRFLTQHQLTYKTFAPTRSTQSHTGVVLRPCSMRDRPGRFGDPAVVKHDQSHPGCCFIHLRVSPACSSTKRIPFKKGDDPTAARVAERHRPFMGRKQATPHPAHCARENSAACPSSHGQRPHEQVARFSPAQAR